MKFSFRPENNFKFWTGQISSPSFRLGEFVHRSPYDETKIAVVLLDEQEQKTDTVTYFTTITDTRTFLRSCSSEAITRDERYFVSIGKRSGIRPVRKPQRLC